MEGKDDWIIEPLTGVHIQTREIQEPFDHLFIWFGGWSDGKKDDYLYKEQT